VELGNTRRRVGAFAVEVGSLYSSCSLAVAIPKRNNMVENPVEADIELVDIVFRKDVGL